MSNLRHWRARTTSATSSSTSATRRVAVAEELLRDLSKLGPLGLCPLSRCILLLQHAVSLSPATPRLLAGVCPRGCRSGLYHGWVRWRQARRIALQIHALRRCAESTSGRRIRALSGGPAVLASCPADRLHTILSQATVELRPSRWLQRCSVPAFWFLHVLHAPDAVLHGPPWRLSWRLPNSDSSVCAHSCRGRAGYLNCGLAPCTPDIR